MPSLQALEEFKSSFNRIGDEQEMLAEMDLPQTDFPLPGQDSAVDFDLSEPAETLEAIGEDFAAASEAEDDIFKSFDDLLDGVSTSLAENSGGEEAAPAGQEDIDFGDFINSIPDDFSSDDAALGDFASNDTPPDDFALGDFASNDTPADDFALDDFMPQESTASDDFENAFEDISQNIAKDDSESGFADDFGTAALLDGLADELADEQTSAAEEDSAFDLAFGEDGIFGEGEAFGEDKAFGGDEIFGEEEVFGEGEAVESTNFDDTGDAGFGDLGLGDLPDFDISESSDLASEGEMAFGAEETSLESAMGVPPGIPADTSAAGFPDDEDSFDFGGESSDFGSGAVLEEISGDSISDDPFDNFKMDSDALAENFDLSTEEGGGFGGDFSNFDDFSLSGVDSVFDGASAPVSGVSPIAGAQEARTSGRKADLGADDIEEIRLTNEELEQLQATLSSYPLNLRIACQELIAEQAVDPGKMSRLIKLLVSGAPAKESAALASKILDRPISIPKGFEKKTGEELEAEQSSFGYIFIHNFLPVFRLFIVIALVGLCAVYLSWRFIYSPIRADRIYRYGLERIHAGEFARANERFRDAFRIHQRASWFFEYARAFTEARQFTLAEEKYLELLNFTASRNRRGIPDRVAVLEYANMVSVVLGHHERADRILRHNLLDFFPMDRDGLLALGDNAMLWGEHDPSRFEDAREAYARIIERHGRSDLMLERMLMFFIRTDNLGEVLALQSHFMASERRRISAETLAEMGGYFLDKRMEEIRGVPNQFLEHIGGIRQILLRAIRQNPMLPETYYHLARYYYYFNNPHDERLTLEVGLRVFEAAEEGNPRRIRNHINALRRYGEMLIRNREFFPAMEYLERGIRLYESALSRRLLAPAPEFGRLYANMGDLELFTRDGNWQAALDYYRLAERGGWAPPEVQYRMGAAYYHLGQWGSALDRFLAAHREVPLNRRVLYALGNAAFLRGNYFAAQGFYDQLLSILHADQDRLPAIWPSDDARLIELVERVMVAQNNLGVTLEALTERTGDNSFRSRALGLYSDSARAWDILTRDPETMIRMLPAPGIIAPGVNPAFLNIRNNLNPQPGYAPLFFMRIDMDMFEFSEWEILSPPGYRLSAGVDLAR